MLEKYSTWAFSEVLPQIKEIYNDDKYPRHYQNTMYPEYAAVTHSKIEVHIFIKILNFPNLILTHQWCLFLTTCAKLTLYYSDWHSFTYIKKR